MGSSTVLAVAALLAVCTQGLKLTSSSCSEEPIPDTLLFNYKKVLIDEGLGLTDKEHQLVTNVINTINVFKKRNPKTKVLFADDAMCKDMIMQAHGEELATVFENEKTGMFKSDICRLSQLYIHGGHYFDNDLEVVKVPNSYFEKCTSFASVLGQSQNIFQAYLAAAPGHPLIKLAMDRLLEAHQGKLEVDSKKMGPETLQHTIEEYTKSSIEDVATAGKDIHLFRETKNLAERPRAGLCHVQVTDMAKNERVFWSRAIPNSESDKFGAITCKQMGLLSEDKIEEMRHAVSHRDEK